MPFRQARRLGAAHLAVAALLPFLTGPAFPQTPLGSAFTYQGRLLEAATPANASFDLEFSLWDAEMDGAQIGSTIAVNGSAVVDGLVSATLDFGADAFDGEARWLQIALRETIAAGEFTTLAPRRPVDPNPQSRYAVSAGNAATADIATSAGNAVLLNGNAAAAFALANHQHSTLHVPGSGAPLVEVDGPGNLRVDSTEFVVRADVNRVGIGTLTPSERLHVEGNIRMANDGDLLGVGDIVGAGGLRLSGDVGATDLAITSGGFVGIGTTSPATPLDVATTVHPIARLASSSTIGSWLQIQNSSTGGRFWNFVSTGSGNGEGAGKLLVGNSAGVGLGGPLSLGLDQAGNVGVGTFAPVARLDVTAQNDARNVFRAQSNSTVGTWASIQNTSTGGRIWQIISSGSANGGGAGNLLIGESASVLTTANSLVSVQPDGDVGIGTLTPSTRLDVVGSMRANTVSVGTAGVALPLEVQGSASGSDTSPGSYMARINNSNGAGNADVLWLRVENETLNTGNNFIQFVGGNQARGVVQGNLIGTGVEFAAGGADFAEELPQLDPSEVLEGGDVVGLFAGRISRQTEGADAVMAISTTAVVRGNAQLDQADPANPFQPVAFIGQAPTRVRGSVRAGDFIVASGLNDGTGVAVAEDALTLSDAPRVVGRAWQSSEDEGVKMIVVAVGLPHAQLPLRALAARVSEQEERLEAQSAMLSSQEERLGAIEARLDGRRERRVEPASYPR
jgi:hypothetical protein